MSGTATPNLPLADYASNDPATWTADQMLYVRQTIRNYAAGALWMDHNLGRILDALAASRFKDNTIVTFYSDHGYHLSDHCKWHKFTLYEQAALAPLIVRVPGQTPRKVTSPVSHIDLGATILDLCGIAIPAGHRGVSLKPWTQGQTPADRAIPTFWYGSVSAAKGNKRVTVYQDGTAEMFNIDTDPWARKNIAATDSTFTGLREDVLKLAADWGMLLVEEAVDTSRPSSLQSILGTKATDTRFSTSFVALGDLHPKGRSPGWQKMYSNQTSANPDVKMPPHIEDFQLMGTKAGKMNLSGNDLPNRVNMAGVFWKEFVIDFGAGDDENVTPEKTRIIAYGRAGNDILRAGTWGGSKLYGGSGNDTLYGDDGADLLDGGEGNDSIRGGDGNDTLIAGPGLDTLDGGNGADRLILDAGANDARGGADADTFVVSRTGEVQTIRDLTSTDVLDLTDWAPVQPVSVVQSGADAIVTAGLEKIVCKAATVATVKAVIRGASYV